MPRSSTILEDNDECDNGLPAVSCYRCASPGFREGAFVVESKHHSGRHIKLQHYDVRLVGSRRHLLSKLSHYESETNSGARAGKVSGEG